MANKKSSIKRIRQTLKKNAINSITRASCRTSEKNVRALAAEGKKEEAQKELLIATSNYAKAKNKGVWHANKSARTVSKLTKLVNSL